MDFLVRFLEAIMVFDVRGNLIIAVLLLAFAALLLGFAIEFVLAAGKKIMALKQLKKPLNEERVLFRNKMKGVKSNG